MADSERCAKGLMCIVGSGAESTPLVQQHKYASVRLSTLDLSTSHPWNSIQAGFQ